MFWIILKITDACVNKEIYRVDVFLKNFRMHSGHLEVSCENDVVEIQKLKQYYLNF